MLRLLAATVASALPVHGSVVPGKSLGGLRLGDTKARVLAAWGRSHGVCKGCVRPTWYYNYVRYEPQGAGVEFRRDRVVALFTLWSPTGWRTSQQLRIGDPVARVTTIYGPLTREDCGSYYVLVLPHAHAVTEFYVVNEQVWGFGLSLASVPACR